MRLQIFSVSDFQPFSILNLPLTVLVAARNEAANLGRCLAALTPAPRTISARLAAGHKLDPDTAQRIEVVLRAMRRAGVIDATTAHAAALAPLDFRPAALGR